MVGFCKAHRGEPIDPSRATHDTKDDASLRKIMAKPLIAYDEELIRDLDIDGLIQLHDVADYMIINELSLLCAVAIARQLQGKDVESVYKHLGVDPLEHTPERIKEAEEQVPCLKDQ